MKFTETAAGGSVEILANDHFVGIPYKFTSDAKAGKVVDNKGVCLYDVDHTVNPNGTLIVHGFINVAKVGRSELPTPAQIAMFPMIKWLNADGTIYQGSDGK